ncbi:MULTISPECIES: hypothetical protein [unclassified Sphingopyxis]|uniref:hypothetical protein n=1 Tax=unclassified Sphingopyxis TaxID=2614943 RepID=UPI0028652B88|nr:MULTISPECIES: hypothetical protein [unclassified Sphingopyxis]MDR6834986.1 hypothetical protein [Sphingopyxis sp. BE122]MDR7227257.1 hypothetical protein [Sphingopyxis sp. BE259]
MTPPIVPAIATIDQRANLFARDRSLPDRVAMKDNFGTITQFGHVEVSGASLAPRNYPSVVGSSMGEPPSSVNRAAVCADRSKGDSDDV